MVLKYGLTKYDYKAKQARVSEWIGERNNALAELKKLADSFIYSKEGVQDIKIYDQNCHDKPFAHFLYRDSSKREDKLIVKRKIKIPGYLYDTAKYDNIISYYLTEYDEDYS